MAVKRVILYNQEKHIRDLKISGGTGGGGGGKRRVCIGGTTVTTTQTHWEHQVELRMVWITSDHLICTYVNNISLPGA